MKGKQWDILDHGFIRILDYMGNDLSIVQSARISYGSGSKGEEQDRRLLRYLMKNRHTSPFEMCEIKLHIKTPIFIARQWLRHRTASVNEYSLRYSKAEELYYLPELEQYKTQSTENKQGKDQTMSANDAATCQQIIDETSVFCMKQYQKLIQKGLCQELARICLPLNLYTSFYWKIDLHNLLHFIKLRMDSHAQYEIQIYARILLEIVKLWCPVTYQAFCDFHLESA